MLMRAAAQPPAAGRPARSEMGALRADLLHADDAKIRQIVALLEASAEPGVRKAVLEPLRRRLSSLKPPRMLRFTRLLFMPLDGLIVPAPEWKPGHATIPRSVLEAMSRTVQAALGEQASAIETMIIGHHTDEAEIVSRTGLATWGRAAEILGRAPAPIGWAETGLPPGLYAPLARAIATVLRSASALRDLERDVEIGVLQPDEQTIRDIVASLSSEPAPGGGMLSSAPGGGMISNAPAGGMISNAPAGGMISNAPAGTMVFKLLLRRLPHVVPRLRQLIILSGTPADRAMLQTAMDEGTDALLADMEDRSELTEGLRDGVFSAVGTEVQRIATLLRDIDQDPGAGHHRARLSGIRKKLDEVCRGRFVEGITNGLVGPLAVARAAIDGAGQRQMESFARDLRTIETAGRKLGNPAAYDALLGKASEAVQAAVRQGSIGTMAAVRLVEILAGPEMADEFYRKNAVPVPRVA
ncbi:hypothetical protein [Rhodopila sp.]|uniref:hypothetical protein n=1 Tax=Rhodopila sp. TaxID=2480087 RepID=UPI003D0C54A1